MLALYCTTYFILKNLLLLHLTVVFVACSCCTEGMFDLGMFDLGMFDLRFATHRRLS